MASDAAGAADVDPHEAEATLSRQEVADAWLDASGGLGKAGRIYGLGTTGSMILGPSVRPRHPPPSTSAAPPETFAGMYF